MGIHFFDHSPSGPAEQLARLGPALSLLRAKIHCVVWAEDALSIVHRVPTGLFDQQLLVPNGKVHDAVRAICADLPYSMTPDGDDDRTGWRDVLYNKDRPHAFDLQTSTVFLRHNNPEEAYVAVSKPYHATTR